VPLLVPYAAVHLVPDVFCTSEGYLGTRQDEPSYAYGGCFGALIRMHPTKVSQEDQNH